MAGQVLHLTEISANCCRLASISSCRNWRLCFARIKSAFTMNNIQRADVTLLHVLWMTKLQFATHRRISLSKYFLKSFGVAPVCLIRSSSHWDGGCFPFRPFSSLLKVDIQNVIYFLSGNSLSHQIIREEMIIFRLVLAGFHIGTVYITAIN